MWEISYRKFDTIVQKNIPDNHRWIVYQVPQFSRHVAPLRQGWSLQQLLEHWVQGDDEPAVLASEKGFAIIFSSLRQKKRQNAIKPWIEENCCNCLNLSSCVSEYHYFTWTAFDSQKHTHFHLKKGRYCREFFTRCWKSTGPAIQNHKDSPTWTLWPRMITIS